MGRTYESGGPAGMQRANSGDLATLAESSGFSWLSVKRGDQGGFVLGYNLGLASISDNRRGARTRKALQRRAAKRGLLK